jgi:hypothetical protein
MTRKLHLQSAGALYHVMSRGDRREPIVRVGEGGVGESTVGLDRQGAPLQGAGRPTVAGADDGALRVDRAAPGDGQPIQRVESRLCGAEVSKVRTDTFSDWV